MKRLALFIVFLLSLLIIGVPLLLYFNNFHNQSVSDESSDWGQFGDFLNPFIALVNMIILGYISFRVMQLEESRDIANRPFLDVDFVYPQQQSFVTWNMIPKDFLQLKNIGKSIAANVTMAVVENGKTNRILSENDIPVDSQIGVNLNSVKWEYCIIRYEDTAGRKFTTQKKNPDVIPTLSEDDMDILLGKEPFLVRAWIYLKRKLTKE